MKLTVYHDGQYFVGMIEREENGKLYAVRHIFGTEPSDEEVLLFVMIRCYRILIALLNAE